MLLGQGKHGVELPRNLEISHGIAMIGGSQDLLGQPPIDGGKSDVAEINAARHGRTPRARMPSPACKTFTSS